MDVLLAATAQAAGWRRAFADALPDARVHVWPDGPDEVDFALVWKPPRGVFERVRVRRAIFNLGAGVDALLALPTLPRGVPIVRLEDAGMAMQMAEYVTLAVLGAYREQRVYAEQQREGRWQPHDRLRKDAFGIGLLGLGVLGQAVAEALRPFGFPLHGWSRSRRALTGMETFSGADGLRSLLARSRVLVVLLPLTPAEHRAVHIVDDEGNDIDLDAVLDAMAEATDPEADAVIDDALDIDSDDEADAAAEATADEEDRGGRGRPVRGVPRRAAHPARQVVRHPLLRRLRAQA